MVKSENCYGNLMERITSNAVAGSNQGEIFVLIKRDKENIKKWADLKKFEFSEDEISNIRKELYRWSDEDSSLWELKLPVLFERAEKANVVLKLNILQMAKIYNFGQGTQRKFREAFGVKLSDEITTEHELKRKFELLLANGTYRSKTELARALGYSDSYVCRVLKHKK